MWILFLGAHASSPPSSPSVGAEAGVRRWFVFQLRRVARDTLCLRGFEEVRRILKQHFYVDRVYRKSLMKIWEEVVSA
jgi:hypothetical protein